ncbi:hypothetical protein [Occallatibacter riparius]|uniref:DUF4252 domain-containing protein n=1 Tax=Occallatibacter riparius TaxID=1002689 RepID=A0A9J7BR45_9BACT|nr:hypothetical protein [Occallatibacter riparius]UWZ85055.1 hypothetical protein MOP44_03710 [Occallatibacter riparius]
MRRFLFVFVCFIALVVPVAVLASSGEGGFDGVVRSLELKYHVHATRIPFLGLISFVARKATQDGVSNLHVAEFEHFDVSMDGEELNRMVEQKLGAGWERMIRETKRNGSEQTLIFVHPEGKRMGMFIVDADGNDLNVVQLSVDPDHLNESIGKYDHHDKDWDNDSD